MSKRQLLWLCIFFLKIPVLMAQIKTINVTSYGAKPNDKISDQAAFNKIAAFINKNKGNVKVVFPAGKYMVGPTYHYNKARPVYPTIPLEDVFALQNCKNVAFEGTGKVQIVFEDGMSFGIFPEKDSVVRMSVHVGALFRLTGCTDISIKNIAADGNNQKMVLLQKYGVGNNPYEREHEGLLVFNSQRLRIENCQFNYFGRDGSMLLQDPAGIPVKDISFSNCTFNNNGRNGFSWCGGDKVSFVNCIFNNNSKGIIQTNPGAGLDIEPELSALCTNGSFVNCEFANNGGYAIMSGYTTASDVVFDKCRITGSTNYALHCVSPRFRITNSTIAGSSLLYYDAATEADGTKFLKCIFTDSIVGKKVHIEAYEVGILGRYVQFDECTFTGYKFPIAYIEVKGKKILGEQENAVFKNCAFNALFKKPSTWDRLAFVVTNANFENCTFKTAGYADFRLVLSEEWRKLFQKNNKFIN